MPGTLILVTLFALPLLAEALRFLSTRTGRTPPAFEAREDPRDEPELLIDLHQIDRFLTPDAVFSDRLGRIGTVHRVGCYEHLQRSWCAYRRR